MYLPWFFHLRIQLVPLQKGTDSGRKPKVTFETSFPAVRNLNSEYSDSTSIHLFLPAWNVVFRFHSFFLRLLSWFKQSSPAPSALLFIQRCWINSIRHLTTLYAGTVDYNALKLVIEESLVEFPRNAGSWTTWEVVNLPWTKLNWNWLEVRFFFAGTASMNG